MKIYNSSQIDEVKKRLNRKSEADESVTQSARNIVADVRRRGDAALFEYTKKFDGFDLNENNIRVTDEEIAAAIELVPQGLLSVLKKSAANIAAFHEKQKREGYKCENGGAVTGRLIIPMRRAGVYVPGGKAAYPSSVLMNIIPAKIAGVEEVIMATPPDKDGRIEPLTLAAASIAGADTVLRMGGAQAVAALAYGTNSVPKADIITGPGNAYVAAAKREIYGSAGIDMIAGPSEVLIIADESANPAYIAADFLSQAEHDEQAASVLITTSEDIAKKAAVEIEKQLKNLLRRSMAKKSVDDFGTIIITQSIEEAFEISNDFAPEHLEILTKDPWEGLKLVRNAGAVFLGEYSPEPLGDYFAGPNHILPTAGTAKFSSPLSVDDFIKKTNYVCYDEAALKECYNDIRQFALAEGLDAHAKSAAIRFEE